MFFSCKKVSPTHPHLIFNRTVVSKLSEYKYLGLVLKSDFTIDKHHNKIIIKAKKNVGILKHLSKFLPLKTLDQMYKALVRSHLVYCDIIFHIPPVLYQPPSDCRCTALWGKLKEFNINQLCLLPVNRHGSNRTKLYEELGRESLSDRRMSRRKFIKL